MRFRKLSPNEAWAFQGAARKDYVPFTPIQGIWHPIYQQECVNINREHAVYVEDEASNAETE